MGFLPYVSAITILSYYYYYYYYYYLGLIDVFNPDGLFYYYYFYCYVNCNVGSQSTNTVKKGKIFPLQSRCGPEGE